MIKIKKSKKAVIVPYVSKTRAGQCMLVEATKRLKKKYVLEQTLYNVGQRTFSFSESLYGHLLIKQALMIVAQHSKCCYCEISIKNDPTLEHYRPKQGYQQSGGDKLHYPGYYWLAYDWSNMLFACNKCNRLKGNLFPLFDNRSRVKNHLKFSDCNRERPVLINPSKEDPTKFLTFAGCDIINKNLKKSNLIKAIATIEILQLDRDGLHQERLEHYQQILAYRDALFLTAKTPAAKQRARRAFRSHINRLSDPSQKFSLMVRSNFRQQ